MEKDDFIEDDFLRELIHKTPLESPSDAFVDRVMEQIAVQKEVEKKPFYLYLKSLSGYAALAAFVLIFLFTSDFQIFNFLPGKDMVRENFLPMVNAFVQPFKSLFGDAKSLSLPLMIVVSAGMFFVLDMFLSRRRVAS